MKLLYFSKKMNDCLQDLSSQDSLDLETRDRNMSYYGVTMEFSELVQKNWYVFIFLSINMITALQINDP